MARGGLPSGELVFSEILTSLKVKINTSEYIGKWVYEIPSISEKAES
jgi:hypothetical protein